MLLLRCLGYLFVGMAGAVLFLGGERGDPDPERLAGVPDLVARADAAPATAPLTASSLPDEPATDPSTLLSLASEDPVDAPLHPDFARSLIPGEPVTFYPTPRPLDTYVRRDAPADLRSSQPASADAGTEGLLYVSGNRVNLRAGPGTDRRVVAALTGGMEAEAIGPPEGGWQRIRVVATGEEGWMADRFLTTRRP